MTREEFNRLSEPMPPKVKRPFDFAFVLDCMSDCLNRNGGVDPAEMERSFFRLVMMMHSNIKKENASDSRREA